MSLLLQQLGLAPAVMPALFGTAPYRPPLSMLFGLTPPHAPARRSTRTTHVTPDDPDDGPIEPAHLSVGHARSLETRRAIQRARRESVLAHIRTHGSGTKHEISAALELNVETVSDDLSAMRDEGRIVRVGSGVPWRWKVAS